MYPDISLHQEFSLFPCGWEVVQHLAILAHTGPESVFDQLN